MNQKCILYLEDEKDLAEDIVAELTDFGIKVIHTDEALDGISKAANQEFDLLIVDINLKHGTGDRVIKSIKSTQNHINFETPILVVSSHITAELVHTIGRDIEYALVKPFDLDTLLENVFTLLKFCPTNKS